MSNIRHRGAATAALESKIRERFEALKATLNERSRRLWAAAEAQAVGSRANALVSRATGISRQAIARGHKELADPSCAASPAGIRRPGGGRDRLTDKDPTLLAALDQLIEPSTRGDPESLLRWTCKSTRNLAMALQ